MNQKFTSTFLGIFFFLVFSKTTNSQSCTGINAGTPSTTQVCSNFQSVTAGSGSSPCAGAGHGGAGDVRIIQFCTNASASCIQMNFSGLSSTDGTAYSLYTGCSGGALSGYVAGSASCDGSSTTSMFTTAGLGLSPNTCYYLRVWTKNAPSAGAQVCIKTNPVVNDYCTGGSQISTSPQAFNNYCMTAGSNGSYTEPAPGAFCAGSLENNAWYAFTTASTCASPCTVTMSISNIICSGGGSGFQIGFFSGTCGSLSNFGCTSGSGGSVVTTITGLGPNQTVIVGIDGNAGANCSYSLSATNTIPLPVEMFGFNLLKASGYIDVQWSTATEKNNKWFTVEKSNDATTFIEVGKVAGEQISHSNKYYSVKDISPSRGINYYRIKQTDYDGTTTYSQMKVVNYDGVLMANFEIVPNPSDLNSSALLTFNDLTGKEITITICDITGKIVFERPEHLKENVYQLPVLEKGVYFIRVTGIENSIVKRMIVK